MEQLQRIGDTIDRLNEHIGRAVSWAALMLVMVQFAVVILRYVFGVGSIFLQESLTYFHGLLFMAGAGYTLLNDGHVRVDIFYREAGARTRAMVDLAGALVLLLPVCALIWWLAWPFAAASWRVLEGSAETSGIQAVFLLKSMLLLFAGLVGAQGLSMAASAALCLATGRTGTPHAAPPGL